MKNFRRKWHLTHKGQRQSRIENPFRTKKGKEGFVVHYAKYLLPTFEQNENTLATTQMSFLRCSGYFNIGQKQVFLPIEK